MLFELILENTEELIDKPLPSEPSNYTNNLSPNNSVHKNNVHDQNNEPDIQQDNVHSSPNA